MTAPPTSLLTRDLYQQITELQLLDRPNNDYRFVLEHTPFGNGDLDEEDSVPSNQTEASNQTAACRIQGKIYPTLAPYNTAAFRIEITLPSIFPMDAPKVRFLTPIYHINVAQNGT